MAFEGSPLIIGHRGAAGLVPENTLPGFARAIELGVDALELDVHVCEDRLCVIHDDTLERTTSGTGPIASHSLASLRALDAGGGASVPLLEEVLALVPEGIGINIELKGANTALPLARLLAEGVARAPARFDLLVSSFDHSQLRTFRECSPEIPVAPLFSRWRGDPVQIARDFGSRYINLSRKLITPARCRALKAAGLQMLVYTINDLEEARHLVALGITGVFTDYPDRITRDALADQAPSPGGISRR